MSRQELRVAQDLLSLFYHRHRQRNAAVKQRHLGVEGVWPVSHDVVKQFVGVGERIAGVEFADQFEAVVYDAGEALRQGLGIGRPVMVEQIEHGVEFPGEDIGSAQEEAMIWAA